MDSLLLEVGWCSVNNGVYLVDIASRRIMSGSNTKRNLFNRLIEIRETITYFKNNRNKFIG